MNIYYIREFWFDDFYDGSGNVQRATITWTDFEQQNIKVTAQLNVFGPGAYIVEDHNTITGNVGSAAVGIKSYDYIDDRGNPQHVDNTYFVPHATIYKCVGIQLELAFNRAWSARPAPSTILRTDGDEPYADRICRRPGKEQAHKSTHVIYDTRSGHIVATHHFIGGAASPKQHRSIKLLKDAHEKSRIPIDHLEIVSDPDFPHGEGEVRVDHAAKRLVRSGVAPAQRIRP